MLFTFRVNPQLHTLVESNSSLRLIWIFFVWPRQHSEYANQTDSLCTRLRRVLFYNQNLGKLSLQKNLCVCVLNCASDFIFHLFFCYFFFYIQKQITSTQVYIAIPTRLPFRHHPITHSRVITASAACKTPSSTATTMFISAFLSFFANYWSIKRILMRIIVFPLTM